ncbi:MAG: citrate transporter [Lachnospiraceae bacterium]|nr:citrate transporter [Lachnospiraceae bacterium]
MQLAQILAIIIFVMMFVLIVTDKIERHYVTLGCGLATIVIVFGIVMRSPATIMESLNLRNIFTLGFWHTSGAETASIGINWATIIFIAGMMVMVEGMALSGFFRWLCMKIAKLVNYKPVPLLISFMVMSFCLAMFIDSITVILFLAAVTVELAKLLKLDPVPMILSEIFCANLGGSATMCGDPPNIIIGTALHYSFFDFLKNTGLMAVCSLVLIIIYFYFSYRNELVHEEVSEADIAALPSPESAINDKKEFIYSFIIFGLAVVLLVSHEATGLTVAFIGTFIALITFIVFRKDAKEIISKIDFKTLLFFIGLFVVVSGLEATGVLEILANFIGKVSGGDIRVMIAIIIWVSAIASAVVDNIPFSATMVPVIQALASTMGVDLSTLAWALAIGTDVGGSATPIGASANVVGTSVAIKNGYIIGWGKYCRTAIPATIIVIAVSMVMIFIRYT